VLTGYKRSSRDTYLQRLRERGLIEPGGAEFVATDAGVAALGADFAPLPTGAELREHWLARLPEGERRVLDYLVGAHPDPVQRTRSRRRRGISGRAGTRTCSGWRPAGWS
jgi:hypothetical protein